MTREETINQLSELADEARERFGGLSEQQLNWKPSEKRWSVAQCLDHLITLHSLYFPTLEELATGDRKPSFWEKYSPFSGLFGRLLIKTMDPGNRKKSKTAPKAQPSTGDIDGRIVERFCEHQSELISHLRRIPDGIDPEKTIITSPLLALVTYSLEDTCTVLVLHCRRHFGQAKEVMGNEGFPA